VSHSISCTSRSRPHAYARRTIFQRLEHIFSIAACISMVRVRRSRPLIHEVPFLRRGEMIFTGRCLVLGWHVHASAHEVISCRILSHARRKAIGRQTRRRRSSRGWSVFSILSSILHLFFYINFISCTTQSHRHVESTKTIFQPMERIFFIAAHVCLVCARLFYLSQILPSPVSKC